MNPTRSLGARLILLLSSVLVLTLGTYAWVSIDIQKRQFEEDVERFAITTSDLIRSGVSRQMLLLTPDAKHRAADIDAAIETAAHQPTVRRIRIFDKSGVIRYSSERTEIGTSVDEKAESCVGCHEGPEPLASLQGRKRIRLFSDEDHRMMGLTTPFDNEAACQACHDRDAKVLGTLDIQMSLEEIDTNIRATQRELILWGIFSLFAIAAITGLCVWRFVHRPVRRLIEGTRRVGAGDLEHTIPTDSRDEIGELARSFNSMTGNLRSAQAELENWARTLEHRVEEKTRELRDAQQQVIQAEKLASVGKLSAMVAHEINNPLAGVLTYSKLVAKMLEKIESVPPEKRDSMLKYLGAMSEETERCGKIVKNLLAFSRQSLFTIRSANLHEVIEKSVFMVQHKLDLQGIRLVANLDPDVPPIDCDANRIQQVLLAVFINAIEAMPEGGEIRVTTELAPPAEIVRISVRDTGTGIPEEVLQHVFEPFTTTKAEGKGVGLGMSVVHGIISQHRGEVDVLSAPGEGTCVVIDLPLRQEPRHGEEQT